MQFPIETVITTVLVGAIGSVVAVSVVPLLQVMLRYGKTREDALLSTGLVGWVSHRLTVPKKWFLHFYVYYFGLTVVIMSYPTVFWGKLALLGFYPVVNHPLNEPFNPPISAILSHMIIIQSGRRLVESVLITKFSPTARINITHYGAGIIFYLAITMTVGLIMQQRSLEWNDFALYTRLGFLEYSVLAIFMAANVDQFCNHLHLRALVKYTEPTQGLFNWVAAAHYFDEVVIYMSITILGCLEPHILYQNKRNLILCLLFVIINLSASATQSLNYYQARGTTKKYAIFPWVY